MKRHYLTLKASYLPGWSTYEGIRELVQNARDAEVQDDAPMKVEFTYRQRNKTPVGTIIISNEGTTIPKEAFLIGHTSKEGRSDLIGRFGEGFKFGILALLRQTDMQVKIRNGNETWNPLICRHKDYDSDVLAFDVADGNRWENRIQIEIIGVTEQEWNSIREKFLFLNPPSPESVIEVYGGKVLLSPEYEGKLFVKGMYVCKNNQLTFGYDINDADIDRDRRMVNDVSSVTARLLTAALSAGKLTDKVYELLTVGSAEVSNIAGWSLDDAARDVIVEKFQEQYGENTVAVESDDQIVELGHLGTRGVRLPWNLQSIISSKLGTARDVIARLKTSARHVYEFSDLTEFEKDNLVRSQEILKVALADNNFPMDLCNNIKIVEFNDSNMRGTYSSSEKMVRVARSELQKVSSTLFTLIEATAHHQGPNGSKQHGTAIGELAESAFDFMLEKYSERLPGK